MHTNAVLVERRIDRFVAERIVPAVYRSTAPLTVTAWDVPDEPVPFDVAVAQDYTEVPPGHRWGPAWGTTWFHVTGSVPSGWVDADGASLAGTAVEVIADLGFSTVQPGFQAEGMAYRPSAGHPGWTVEKPRSAMTSTAVPAREAPSASTQPPVSYTHLRAHETDSYL